MFIFNERGNQNQNAESKSRGRIANLQYKIKSEWIINKLQKHTQAPKKIKSGVFFWLKPGAYYLLVLSNIDFGAGGGQDTKLLALVQSLQQRLDDVEFIAAHTISELGQVKKNLVVTETKINTLQGAMISLYNQTTAFQVEQQESAGLAAENMSKLMLKLGVSPGCSVLVGSETATQHGC